VSAYTVSTELYSLTISGITPRTSDLRQKSLRLSKGLIVMPSQRPGRPGTQRFGVLKEQLFQPTLYVPGRLTFSYRGSDLPGPG
jgi:hypothetical protein